MSTLTKKETPIATIASPRKWDGESLYKECKDQGIYPSFESGSFTGYIDRSTNKKVATALPTLSQASYEQYKKAEAAVVDSMKNAKTAKPKTVKAPKEKKARGSIQLEQKVTIVTKEPPLRAGALERFKLLKDGMTVAKYIELGGKRTDLWWNAKQGWITLA